MSQTQKNNRRNNNKTQKNKNKKCSKINKNNYKSCKSKLYKSVYGGRYNSNLFF